MGGPESGAWDAAADTFDDEADHGLCDPSVRAAWGALLAGALPPAPAAVADLGCGTGSLAVLLAESGHRVCGLDGSARMLGLARDKAARHRVAVGLVRGDAARPPFAAGVFDVVLARHVLWALPDPGAVLGRWIARLRPGGRLVLVEGRWDTGAGIPAAACAALVEGHGRRAEVTALRDAALWGKVVTDERYLLLSPPRSS